MNEVAQLAVRDGVAVITLDNPPVNGLGNALRARILELLRKADGDPAVQAALLIGAGKAFSALIGLPVVIIFTASAIGTMRGRRCVPPEPGRMPSFTSGRPSWALGEAIR